MRDLTVEIARDVISLSNPLKIFKFAIIVKLEALALRL